jgi:hypothetical protein
MFGAARNAAATLSAHNAALASGELSVGVFTCGHDGSLAVCAIVELWSIVSSQPGRSRALSIVLVYLQSTSLMRILLIARYVTFSSVLLVYLQPSLTSATPRSASARSARATGLRRAATWTLLPKVRRLYVCRCAYSVDCGVMSGAA